MFGKPNWFRPKTFGWGLTPITWQGWAYTGGWVGLLVAPFSLLLIAQAASSQKAAGRRPLHRPRVRRRRAGDPQVRHDAALGVGCVERRANGSLTHRNSAGHTEPGVSATRSSSRHTLHFYISFSILLPSDVVASSSLSQMSASDRLIRRRAVRR